MINCLKKVVALTVAEKDLKQSGKEEVKDFADLIHSMLEGDLKLRQGLEIIQKKLSVPDIDDGLGGIAKDFTKLLNYLNTILIKYLQEVDSISPEEVASERVLNSRLKNIKDSILGMIDTISKQNLSPNTKKNYYDKVKKDLFSFSITQRDIKNQEAPSVESIYSIIQRIHRKMFEYISKSGTKFGGKISFAERQPGYAVYNYMKENFDGSWQKKFVTKGNLPDLRAFTGSGAVGIPRQIILTDKGVYLDLPAGYHSFEISAINIPGNQAIYVRYVDNKSTGGRIRLYLYQEYLKEKLGITDIVYEGSSQSLCFKIPEINYTDEQSDHYFLKKLKILNQLIEGSMDQDNVVKSYENFIPEAKSPTSFTGVMQKSTELQAMGQGFVNNLVADMIIRSLANKPLPIKDIL